MPYSALLAAVDYYTKTIDARIMFSMAPALVVPNLVVLFLRLAFGILPNDRWNVICGLAAQVAVMLIAPLSTSHWIVIGLATVSGAATAVVQGSLKSIASQMSPGLPSLLQTGQGAAGMIAPALRIFTKFLTSQLATSVMYYFHIAVAAELSGIMIWWQLQSSRLRYHSKDLTQPLTAEEGCRLDESSHLQCAANESKLLQLLLCLRYLLFSVFWNFSLTMMLFPGVLSQLHSSSSQSQGFVSVCLVGVFGGADVVGKYLPSHQVLRIQKSSVLVALVCLRTAFVPLLLWLEKDSQPFALLVSATAMFGLSNGFCGSATFELIPSVVESADIGRAATAVVFFLLAGRSTGSAIGDAVLQPP